MIAEKERLWKDWDPNIDPDRLLVIADLYEEEGFQRFADFLRWCHKNSKYPNKNAPKEWDWMHVILTSNIMVCQIEQSMYDNLKGYMSGSPTRSWKTYTSCKKAFEALFYVWGELSDS